MEFLLGGRRKRFDYPRQIRTHHFELGVNLRRVGNEKAKGMPKKLLPKNQQKRQVF